MTDYAITNCSCIDGLNALTQKVQLTITSPPYFNVKDYVAYANYAEYLNTLKQVFTLVYNVTDDGRMCCVNLSNILVQRESRSHESSRIPLAFHFVPLMEELGWKFIEDIVWVKPEGAAKNRNGGFFQHRQPVAYKPNVVNEYIFVFQKPSKHLIDKIVRGYDAVVSENSRVDDNYERTNVWKINPATKSKHPAPYPEELVDRLVRYYSFVGDTVLDPFIGSGTTAVVAYRLNRKCIGFETHQEYIDLFEKRMTTVSKTTGLKTDIVLRAEDFAGLDIDTIKQKINKRPKKCLLQILKNDDKYKAFSKTQLTDAIYSLLFVDAT